MCKQFLLGVVVGAVSTVGSMVIYKKRNKSKEEYVKISKEEYDRLEEVLTNFTEVVDEETLDNINFCIEYLKETIERDNQVAEEFEKEFKETEEYIERLENEIGGDNYEETNDKN